MERSSNYEWLQRTLEPALEPDLAICDSHHHLWDFRQGDVDKRYLIDEMLADLSGGHNVVSSVFIECGTMFRAEGPAAEACVGETEFANGIAAMSASGHYGPARIAAGLIATCDLMAGDRAGAVLDAQMAAGGARLKGIRQGSRWHPSDAVPNHRTNPPEGMLMRDDFRAGLKQLARRDLTFDVLCYHTQLAEVADLARAFPDTAIIVNHLGGPIGVGPYAGKGNEVFADWRRGMHDLAGLENVIVKLGGMNMPVNGFRWHERPEPPGSAELAAATRHYFEDAIEAFGVGRCMFESNFPVDKRSCSYTVVWNSFKRITSAFTPTEKAALYHDTAVRVYGL